MSGTTTSRHALMLQVPSSPFQRGWGGPGRPPYRHLSRSRIRFRFSL